MEDDSRVEEAPMEDKAMEVMMMGAVAMTAMTTMEMATMRKRKVQLKNWGIMCFIVHSMKTQEHAMRH